MDAIKTYSTQPPFSEEYHSLLAISVVSTCAIIDLILKSLKPKSLKDSLKSVNIQMHALM